TTRCVHINNRQWVVYFDNEYWSKYLGGRLHRERISSSTVVETEIHEFETDEELTVVEEVIEVDTDKSQKRKVTTKKSTGIKSAKWCYRWVFEQLNKEQLVILIDAIRRADGDFASDDKNITTSCPRFRDELLHIMLHAGYSVSFECQ